MDSECDNADLAGRRARKSLADSALNAFTITADVRGHRSDDGVIWTPGQCLRVFSEPDDLDDEYFLIRRTLRGGRDSTRPS